MFVVPARKEEEIVFHENKLKMREPTVEQIESMLSTAGLDENKKEDMKELSLVMSNIRNILADCFIAIFDKENDLWVSSAHAQDEFENMLKILPGSSLNELSGEIINIQQKK